MGVNFHAYSNVRTEPLPIEYRRTHRKWTETEKQRFHDVINQDTPERRLLLLAASGVRTVSSGELIFPEKIMFTDEMEEMEEKVLEHYEQTPDFIKLCFLTNTIYYKTPATHAYSCDSSYSSYSEFTELLAKLNNGEPLSIPQPFTTDYPLISAEKCRQILGDLKVLRHYFVQESWEPDLTMDFGLSKDDQENKEESWFFKEFYTLISLGANCGLVCMF